MRRAQLLIFIAILVAAIALVVASETVAAEELEVFAGQDKTVRVGVTVEFNDARLVKPDPPDPERTYSFSWDFDNSKDANLDHIKDNDNESTELFTEWTYHIPKDYIVTLTVDDGFSKAKNTLKVTVKANEAPEIIANNTESAFKEEEHTFYAEAIDDFHPQHQLRWHWEFGDGSSSEEAPPVTHQFMAVRVYTVKIRVTDPDGKASIHTIMVEVEEKPGELGTVTEVKDGKIEDTKDIRENGYVAYTLDVQKRHDIHIRVKTSDVLSPPVAVLLFENENDYLDYELDVGGGWMEESNDELGYAHDIRFKAEKDMNMYIVIDNGHQIGGGFGAVDGMTTVKVEIEDEDRDSLFVDIPLWVWILILVIFIVVLAFFGVMKVVEVQARQKQEKEAIQRTMAQRGQAVSSLKTFLDNPEDVVKRESDMARRAPAGPPGAPPGAMAGPPPGGPGPLGPPGRPMGPPGRPAGAPTRPAGPPRRPAGPPGPPRPAEATPEEPEEAPEEPEEAPEEPEEAPEEPEEAPEEAVVEPPTLEEPEAIPTEFAAPPIVEAPKPGELDGIETVSTGPAYVSTEQPKRISTEFELKDLSDEVPSDMGEPEDEPATEGEEEADEEAEGEAKEEE